MEAPSRRRRVTKRPEDRRHDLMEAAVAVMARVGVEAATISDITQAAGVAKGTFYLYFDSKEHLLAALRERFVEESLSRAYALAARVGRDDWWALVDATVEAFIDFAIERSGEMALFHQAHSSETRGVLADCERKLNGLFANGIRAGMEADAFRVTDPEVTAVLLHHAIEGTLVEAVLSGEPVDRERLVRSATELARKTLAP